MDKWRGLNDRSKRLFYDAPLAAWRLQRLSTILRHCVAACDSVCVPNFTISFGLVFSYNFSNICVKTRLQNRNIFCSTDTPVARETWWRCWFGYCATAGRSRVRFPMSFFWNISLTDSFWLHYDSEVDSASDRNEYYVQCRAGNLPHACADCLKGLSKSVMGNFALYLLGIFCNIFSVIRYCHWTTACHKICNCHDSL